MSSNNNKANDPIQCQICGKIGHSARDCWYRFTDDYLPEEKSAGAANLSSYGVDTNWYADSGATNHITGELEKLTVHDNYRGTDQIHTADGSGMDISHIGHSVINTLNDQIHLRNILHVPHASKNLLSVHKIAVDNHAYLEFWPTFFVIKDQTTGRILYRGRCRGGLYPLIPIRTSNKQAFGAIKLSPTRWHDRLGHASFSLVESLLKKINSRLLVSAMLRLFVILAEKQKVINYLILSPLVFLLNHCN